MLIDELNEKLKKNLFVILITTACIANTIGFLSNFLMFGMSPPSIICGICAGSAFVCGIMGIVLNKPNTATIIIILMMSLIEFPFLFYVYGSPMGVYLILGIAVSAVYIPNSYNVPIIILNILIDIATIMLWHFFPLQLTPIDRSIQFAMVLCSYVIVAVSLSVILCSLCRQFELQHQHSSQISQQLEEEERSFNAIHEALRSGKWSFRFDENDMITACSWSEVFRHMIGYCDETDFPNKIESWSDLLHPDDKERVLREYWGTVHDHSGEKIYDVQFRLKTKNADYRWFRAAGRITRRADGSADAFYGVFIDTTDLVTSEEHLLESLLKMNQMNKELRQALDNFKQADYDRRIDFLTGLHSRQDMYEMLQDNLSGKRQDITAMYMLDIDNFKGLNDRYGHTYGDECLRRIGSALNVYGEKNNMIFYRYGGEEILGIRFLDKKPANQIASELVQLIRDQKVLRDDAPSGIVTISLGYTANHYHYEKMIDMADAAMYQAKQNGKNQAFCFDEITP